MKHVIFTLAWLCALVSTSFAQQERLRVVTTTGDLRSLVKAVGAERVVVSSLVPQGERAEQYQPRLNDIAVLKGARMVVRAAIGIDPWFDKVLARAAQKNGRTGIERGEPGHLDASAAVAANDPLSVSAAFRRGRRDTRGGSSPHYWLDPKTADAITGDILKTFVALDPANKSYYENNRRSFLSRLDSKVGDWQARLIPLQSEPMIAFHDDWAYFANRFRLNIIDYITVRDGAPPKLGRIGELAKLVKDKGVRLILTEYNQPERHANILAQRTGAKVVHLAGTVGELPNTDDYIAMFEANVNALVAAHEKK